MSESERYAFGKNYKAGEACPALAATGENPPDELITPIEMYDSTLRERTREEVGTVSEEQAKDVWLQVIDNLEVRLEFVKEGAPTRWTEKQLQKARMVARKLGWM